MMQQMTKRRKSLKKPMADKGRGVRIVLQLCYNFFFGGGETMANRNRKIGVFWQCFSYILYRVRF